MKSLLIGGSTTNDSPEAKGQTLKWSVTAAGLEESSVNDGGAESSETTNTTNARGATEDVAVKPAAKLAAEAAELSTKAAELTTKATKPHKLTVPPKLLTKLTTQAVNTQPATKTPAVEFSTTATVQQGLPQNSSPRLTASLVLRKREQASSTKERTKIDF